MVNYAGAPAPPDRLSATFAALADPTRRAILARLTKGETSVTEFARPFEMSLPAVSKHLKVLQRAGLIERGRNAQWRPCRLDAGPLKDVADYAEDYRRFWEERFDRLDDYLRELQKKDNLASRRRSATVWSKSSAQLKAASRRSPGWRSTWRRCRECEGKSGWLSQVQ